MYFNLQNSTTITWIFLFGVNDQKACFFYLEPRGLFAEKDLEINGLGGISMHLHFSYLKICTFCFFTIGHYFHSSGL